MAGFISLRGESGAYYVNQTGIRGFCADEDAVVRVDPNGACSDTEAGILTFNPLNQ